MRPTTLLALVLMAMPVAAQAPVQTASVPCTVRIRPRAAADYDLSTQVELRGTISEVQAGSLRLRLPFGTVTVELGGSASTLSVGQSVTVVASKRSSEAGQRLVAREVRGTESTLILRDAQGVPVV